MLNIETLQYLGACMSVGALAGIRAGWRHSPAPLLTTAGVLSIGALACYLIAGTKTVGFLAGIIGILSAIALGAAALGVGIGAAIGAVRRSYHPPPAGSLRLGCWTVEAVVMTILTLIAIVLSVTE